MAELLDRDVPPPMVIRTFPAVHMNDAQFARFCSLNKELQIERSADGEIIIMSPEGAPSGAGNFRLIGIFDEWAERDGTGRGFGSSAGFTLPNGAIRSPDVAWVRNDRLAQLSREDLRGFLPLCPDFVLELRSKSDRLSVLQEKMEEYRENGAQLGWLLDPFQKRVYIYRPSLEMEELQNPLHLSGEPVLPGFTLEVERIWRAMDFEK